MSQFAKYFYLHGSGQKRKEREKQMEKMIIQS